MMNEIPNHTHQTNLTPTRSLSFSKLTNKLLMKNNELPIAEESLENLSVETSIIEESPLENIVNFDSSDEISFQNNSNKIKRDFVESNEPIITRNDEIFKPDIYVDPLLPSTESILKPSIQPSNNSLSTNYDLADAMAASILEKVKLENNDTDVNTGDIVDDWKI